MNYKYRGIEEIPRSFRKISEKFLGKFDGVVDGWCVVVEEIDNGEGGYEDEDEETDPADGSAAKLQRIDE